MFLLGAALNSIKGAVGLSFARKSSSFSWNNTTRLYTTLINIIHTLKLSEAVQEHQSILEKTKINIHKKNSKK